MKKVLAAVLAAAMSLSMASVAFAANVIDVPVKLPAGASNSLANDGFLDALPTKTELEVDAPLFTYDQDKIELDFELSPGSSYKKVRADVNNGKIAVSTKKLTGNAIRVTIKSKYGVRDFDLDDWKVELDIDTTKDLTAKGTPTSTVVYIKGEGAYSDTQDVSSGDRLAVSKTKWTSTKGETGAIFNFEEPLDDETRIRCNDYVDVYFKGNYGTDKENMRVKTDEITEIEDFFGDIDVDYYDFIGTPKFATKVKVIIDGDPNAYLYEFNKKTGDVTKVDATYESDGWAFTTKTLGTYVLVEEEYDEGNVEKDTTPVEKDETSGDKENPGTGANDMVGVAAALAVVSLVAAGTVAFKKASK